MFIQNPEKKSSGRRQKTGDADDKATEDHIEVKTSASAEKKIAAAAKKSKSAEKKMANAEKESRSAEKKNSSAEKKIGAKTAKNSSGQKKMANNAESSSGKKKQPKASSKSRTPVKKVKGATTQRSKNSSKKKKKEPLGKVDEFDGSCVFILSAFVYNLKPIIFNGFIFYLINAKVHKLTTNRNLSSLIHLRRYYGNKYWSTT